MDEQKIKQGYVMILAGWLKIIRFCTLGALLQIALIIYFWIDVSRHPEERASAIILTIILGLATIVFTVFAFLALKKYREAKKSFEII